MGEGASGSLYCTLGGVAKTNTDGAPYAVANEFICGRLALMLGLPAPPGVMLKTDDGKPAFVCLRFGRKGEKLPPVIPEHVVEDEEFMAAGIIALDSWIANEDRHNRNLAYVREPKMPLQVFDHSHALLGHQAGRGVERLRESMDRPYVGSGCLAPVIPKGGAFPEWADRIRSIHPGVVKDTCRAVERFGAASAEEVQAAEAFLLQRQTRILDYLQADAALPKVTEWGLV